MSGENLSATHIAVFLDIKYLWKESSDILIFFYGVSLQAKAASEKVVVRLVVARFTFHAVRLLNYLIINILEEIQWVFLSFIHGVSHQWKVASEADTFDWVWSVKRLVKLDYRIL